MKDLKQMPEKRQLFFFNALCSDVFWILRQKRRFV